MIYILYIVLFTSTFVKSDIPVHCLKSQVIKYYYLIGSRKVGIFLNPSRKKKYYGKIQTHLRTHQSFS